MLAELLEVREERARLLGYADWADYETETAHDRLGAAIPAFLARLDEASSPPRPLRVPAAAGAAAAGRTRRSTAVTIADFWYVLGAIKREEYDVDAQEVRSYFPFDRVLPGVLDDDGPAARRRVRAGRCRDLA